ncbi:MAG: BspA family leucine-rich repeat surface protein [Bacteroidales bacterium]|nr:BspA family leucine-rich repeat surface protein [Bacteroidales bacterium]
MRNYASNSGWSSVKNNIAKVIFDKSFKDFCPTSCANWFFECINLTTIVNIEKYLNTECVTDMSKMFSGCYKLKELDLSNFKTENVTNMIEMFSGCSNLLNLDVSSFNTGNVTNMGCMFKGCEKIVKLDLSNFNTTKVTNMNLDSENRTSVVEYCGMFENCKNLIELNLCNFNTENVSDFNSMFAYCHCLQVIYVSNAWSTKSAKQNSGNYMFHECFCLYGGKGTAFTSERKDIKYAIIDGGKTKPGYFTRYGDEVFHPKEYAVVKDGILTLYYDVDIPDDNTIYHLGGYSSDREKIKKVVFDVSFSNYKPSSCQRLFKGCSNLIDIVDMDKYFNTEDITNTREMFSGCNSLIFLNLNNFNTIKCTDMSGLFNDCCSLKTIDLSKFETYNVTSMSQMFHNCNSLSSLDLSNFNTSNVKYMNQMFAGCSSLLTLNIHSFNTKNVSTMREMFSYCKKLTEINISTFETDNLTDIFNMFTGCNSIDVLDLSSFNTMKVKNMGDLFSDCYSLKTIYTGDYWGIPHVYGDTYMFRDCFSLYGGDGTKWSPDKISHKYAFSYFSKKGEDLYVPQEYAIYNNGTLTLYYKEDKPVGEKIYYLGGYGNNREKIKTIVFDESFKKYKPNSCYGWFFNCENLTEIIGMNEYLNTEDVTDMSRMFEGCSNLEDLDLSTFDVAKVRDLSRMFWECKNLKTIYVKDNFYQNLHGSSVFYGCSNIVGGGGTTYDSKKIGADYAKLDNGSNNPGYFTYKQKHAIAITMKKDPQNQYEQGMDLKLDDGELEVSFDDNSTETVALTSATISGYDPNRLGEQIITVEYLSLKTEFKVTVNEKKDDPSTPVSEIDTNNAVKIYSYGKTIIVENGGSEIKIIDMSGHIVKTVTSNSNRDVIPMSKSGLYIVKTVVKTQKIMIQ